VSGVPKLAIVAALEREVRPLVKNWRSREQEYTGRKFLFHESGHAVLTCGGIGSEPARRAAEAIIARYQPALIYSVGFAGALDSKLHIGDVIVPRRVVNAGDGSSVDTGQGEGILLSFAAVASPEQKAKLADSYGAQAVDMEAAAVAGAAEARGVPFAAVKAISDESDFPLPAMDRFIDADGHFNSARFAWFVAIRPWMWGTTLRLARNSRRASQALCTWIEHMDMNRALASQPAASQVLGSVRQP
jgi:adenosylhomocysteine nucleosidase